jgi:hypothetical protein
MAGAGEALAGKQDQVVLEAVKDVLDRNGLKAPEKLDSGADMTGWMWRGRKAGPSR